MKNRHGHNSLLIIMLCITLFVGALYAYMYYVVDAAVTKAIQARDIVQLETVNKNQEKEVAGVFADTASDRLRLNSFFIPRDGIVSFIETLESLGTTTGSKVTIVSIDSDNLDGAAEGSMGTARAQLTVTGSWSSVMRTFQLAELLPYKSSIKNVKLDVLTQSVSKDKVARKVWQMSFDLTASMIVAPKIK